MAGTVSRFVSMLYVSAVLFLVLQRSAGATTDANELLQAVDLNQTSVVIEPRIVGGTEVRPGSYRFFAVSSRNSICGATLIHTDILLTAAHCSRAWQPTNNGVYGVMIGTTNRVSVDPGTEYRGIASAVTHPLYSSFSNANDFMLVKLDRASSFLPISLNMDNNGPPPGFLSRAIGFGARSEGEGVSETLQQVDLDVISHQVCSSQYSTSIVDSVMICAGVSKGGKDSCQGDSGGPLFVTSSNNEEVQIGVVSFGVGCARPTHAGVYARVSYAVPWIRDTLCTLSSTPPSYCNSNSSSNPRPTLPPTPPPYPQSTPRPTVRPTPRPTVRPTLRPTPRPNPPRPTTMPTDPNTGTPFAPVTTRPTTQLQPAPGFAAIKIVFRYDENPLDTKWAIGQGWEDVLEGPQPSFVPVAGAEETVWWMAPLGDNYQFRVTDRSSDGISRKDYFTIFQVYEGVEVVIAESNQFFTGYGSTMSFNVRKDGGFPAMTSVPTQSPVTQTPATSSPTQTPTAFSAAPSTSPTTQTPEVPSTSQTPTTSPEPTTLPTTQNPIATPNSAHVKVVIWYDMNNTFIRDWKITEEIGGEILFEAPDFWIPRTATEVLERRDCPFGSYVITLVDTRLAESNDRVKVYQIMDNGDEIVLAQGDGGFLYSFELPFLVSSAAVKLPENQTSTPGAPPTKAPTSTTTAPSAGSPALEVVSSSVPKTQSPTPSPGLHSNTTHVKVVIEYDMSNSQMRDWKIAPRAGGHNLYEASDFWRPQTSPEVLDWTDFPLGAYSITLTDTRMNVSNDRATVYQVMDNGVETIIGQGRGEFMYQLEIPFVVSVPDSGGLNIIDTATRAYSSSPVLLPNTVPQVSELKLAKVSDALLKLVVRYDDVPQNTRWFIRSGDTVLFEGPPIGTVPSPYSVETNTWEVPNGSYQFRIIDQGADGVSRTDFFSIYKLGIDGSEELIVQSTQRFTGYAYSTTFNIKES